MEFDMKENDVGTFLTKLAEKTSARTTLTLRTTSLEHERIYSAE